MHTQRGGWRQRLALARPSDGPPPEAQRVAQSNMVERLLELWSWGYISAPTAQYLAEGAAMDGSTHPEILQLARAGSSGRWRQNCKRDIERNFMASVKSPPTMTVRVPAYNNKSSDAGDVWVDCEILPPHWLFSTNAEEFPGVLRSFGCAGLEEFWTAAQNSNDPHLLHHPLTSKPDWKKRAIPIVLFGDGAKFARTDSLEVVAWGALLARISTWASKYVTACFVQNAQARGGVRTWDEIWKALAWSIGAMFEGVHPVRDHRGQPWPRGSYGGERAGRPLSRDGYFCVVHRVVGDMGWLYKRLGLRLAPAANEPCAWCACNRSDKPFLDLQPTAAWVGTTLTPPQPAPSNHPVFTIVGVSLFSIALDIMHVFDLGVLQHLVGSLFYIWVWHGQLAGAVPSRVDRLWAMVRAEYDRLGSNCRISNLITTMFASRDAPHQHFPRFTGKAMETRQLVSVVFNLAQRFATGAPRDQAILQCVANFMRFYSVLSFAGPVPTAAEHDRLRNALWPALQTYSRLSFACAADGIRAFALVNKHHFALHLLDQCAHLNPEMVWCYPFEDLIGRVQRVAMASKSGMVSVSIPRVILSKYRRVLHRSLVSANSM